MTELEDVEDQIDELNKKGTEMGNAIYDKMDEIAKELREIRKELSNVSAWLRKIAEK